MLVFLLLLTGCGQKSVDSSSGNLISFDVYAINDLHGRLADTDDQPGVDELSTYLNRQSGNRILLATGDMWQGTSESNLTGGRIITEWMNRMDFTAMTVGGHEFDWGVELLRQNGQLAEFPFLGINVYSRDTDQRVDYCQSSLTVEFDGAQIGIIGAIGDCYYSISSQHTRDIYFKTGSELTALVKAEAEKLRDQGADFIIYTIHDGYDRNTADTEAVNVTGGALKDYYDTALSNGYVDLVFEADSHHWYVLKDQYGVYHLQADHYAYYIKTTAYGDSIRSSIDPDGTYYVVTDGYSAYYPYNHMTVIDIYDENTFARDLVADHIAGGGFG